MTPHLSKPSSLSLSVALLALASPAGGQTGERRHPDFEHLSARWSQALEELSIPGMALVVVEGDEVLHLETFGVRNVDTQEPVTPDTLFYIASATKPFVAFAARQLAEIGSLDLDAPVRNYLPRFELADEEAQRTMTVRDLLCHRPGLRSTPIVMLDAYSGQITEDRYYHFLASVQPTGLVTYSNIHFTLAGRVLEAVLEKPWKEVLEQMIFEPAGMSRTTGYADTMYADENVALPTVWADGALVTSKVRKTDATMHAAGGLGTTVADLARWIRVHLNGGMLGDTQLLESEGVEEMVTLQSHSDAMAARKLSGFGLGWMLGNAFGERKAQHGGGYVGSSALITFLPELGLGVAVLANTDVTGNAICKLVTDDVFGLLLAEEEFDEYPKMLDQWKRFVERGSAATPAEPNPCASAGGLSLSPKAYVGEYSNEQWGTLSVALDDELLVAGLGNISCSLHATGADTFRAYAQGSLDSSGSFLITLGEVVAVRMGIEGHDVLFER